MTAPVTDIPHPAQEPLPSAPQQTPGEGGIPVYDPPSNPDLPPQPEPEPFQNPDTPGIDLPSGTPAFI